ncbi:membrane protein DedA, SNARE-associated domain [Rhizobium sp. NFR07]|uniref:DedA family protein n=1 Tax=Rhizobium sp. NFR07 TaxID=1566262 RepID=UPI0008ECB35F|nr:VTT domain-containing protein [Rhizobium sp. NFR07]SFB61700.1 membrane protein DedA, SNARE-associated domain [Rhizobium sp. NFR07]
MEIDPIGVVMRWISIYGLIGLFVAALAERFVPVIPSYGLLLSVGISASDGSWPMPAAIAATSIGSFCGCAACFYCVRALGSERAMRVLLSASGWFGVSADRIESLIASFQRSQTMLAFGMQLVPTVRLFAPVLAALPQSHPQRFLLASAAGIMTWNGLFVGIGFVASHKLEEVNTTTLACAVLGCVLLVEFVALRISRTIHASRKEGSVSCQNS